MGARGSLRVRQHHSDQATQGLHGLEELGDEAREAKRDEEGQSGAGAQTRRHHASDAGRWRELPSSRGGLSGRLQMMAQIMIAQYAPTPSSPAQVRALRGFGALTAPSRPSQEARHSINAALSTS